MSYVKQPQLTITVPVKIFRERTGDSTVTKATTGIFFSQTLGPVYRWESKLAPSGAIFWEWVETNRTAQEFTEVLSDSIPETLYETLKLFYVGKPKPVTRESCG